MAPDASGLPLELWRGLDLKTLEELLAGLELPPRSPAVHQLWRRVLLSSATPPAGAPNDEHFVALRLEALYRSGLLERHGCSPQGRRRPRPRRPDAACQARHRPRPARGRVPGDQGAGRSELRAAGPPQGRNAAAGRLLRGGRQRCACRRTRRRARPRGRHRGRAAAGGAGRLLPPAASRGWPCPSASCCSTTGSWSCWGPVDALQIFDKAEPALLVMLAGDHQSDARLQIAAAEAALTAQRPVAGSRRGRCIGGSRCPAAPSPIRRRRRPIRCCGARCSSRQPRLHGRRPSGRASCGPSSMTRADPGYFLQTARVVAPLLAGAAAVAGSCGVHRVLHRDSLVAGDSHQARQWAEAAGLWHWLALVDIADPGAARWPVALAAALEDLAARGRLGVGALHKLATVLDALDIDVPIPIWDAANRTPQPSGGYLPETGILADLAQSAKRNDAGRTILLVMRTLGPGGPDGANLLALGDAIRALEAHRSRGGRTPAGARSADRGVAARGGQLTRMGGAHGNRGRSAPAGRGVSGNARRRARREPRIRCEAYRRDLDDFLVFLERARSRLPATNRPRSAPICASYRRQGWRRPRGRGGCPRCASCSNSSSPRA